MTSAGLFSFHAAIIGFRRCHHFADDIDYATAIFRHVDVRRFIIFTRDDALARDGAPLPIFRFRHQRLMPELPRTKRRHGLMLFDYATYAAQH